MPMLRCWPTPFLPDVGLTKRWRLAFGITLAKGDFAAWPLLPNRHNKRGRPLCCHDFLTNWPSLFLRRGTSSTELGVSEVSVSSVEVSVTWGVTGVSVCGLSPGLHELWYLSPRVVQKWGVLFGIVPPQPVQTLSVLPPLFK